ncbi:NAD(P)H-hydrate repair Nnr-like enzyme with NAD(P)H-hydrate epimerase domain/mono/diheme cytochrome c family protein [Variovorax ginsengisoli]|uniref:NAD(P)H-hydrate repair Nnr-like enzyme with NAD(P)H-hydrate epimerase domain/mono/diheme cytochrome c family protein n=1 Tax=Variovorax ginsengisoli TaxID=363844 RepID=A0ABT9SEY2_9BURK|nr:hypothetical protein [Variovorax ginsengisoli]MDP9902343.1 NAD(P)H-hydrate repair Nnr-like enzyme with NAD(P)H-hydrate epimerase domain/mono/diheme cytochrome c family protein [Variovorax ginsengisoli]
MADNLATLLTPVIDGLLGQGVTSGLIDPLETQVDYVTDGLSNLLEGSLGDLLGGLLGGGTGGGTGDSLLAPVDGAVDTVVSGLNDGVLADLGLGDSLAPVSEAVDGVTDLLDGVLAPVLGSDFAANNPNALDPVDSLVGDVAAPLTDVLSPVVDGLLGAGATGAVIGQVTTQVDYLTDGVAGLLDGSALGGGGGGTGSALLDPADGVVDTVVSGLDDGVLADLGLGGSLAPVSEAVDGVTDLVGGVLAPVLGSDFAANNPNALDPVDSLVGDVTAPLGDALSPVVDGLLGTGATDTVLGQVTTQVDYLTDGVAGLLDGSALGGDLLGGDLLGGDLLAPVTNLLDGVLGDGSGGGTGTALLDPTDAIVGDVVSGLDHGVLGDLGLGDTLAPVTSAVDGVTDLVDGALAPLVGDTFTTQSPNMLDPVDSVVSEVTAGVGSLASPVVDQLLGAGATSGLVGQVDTQVDFVTDGVAHVLGGDLLNGDLLGGDLLGGDVLATVTDLLAGDLLGGDLLGGDLLGGDVLAPVTDLLGGDLLGGDLLAGDLLAPATDLLGGDLLAGDLLGGDLLAPVTDLLGGVAGGAGGAEGAATALAPVTDLLGGLTGSAGSAGSILMPVTDLLGSGILSSVTSVADAGTVGTAATPVNSLLHGLLG